MESSLISRIVKMHIRCHRHNPPLANQFLEDMRVILREQRQAERDRPIGEGFSIDIMAGNIAKAIGVAPEDVLPIVQAEWTLSYVPVERLITHYDQYFSRGMKWPGSTQTSTPSGNGEANASKSAERAARKGGRQ